MRPNAEQTAILIATLLHRSGERRARISERTIRILSRRKPLRDVFKEKLRAELDDLGIHFMQLERGGFGLIPAKALDGAPAITAKKYVPDEVKKVKKGADDTFFDRLRSEVMKDADEGDEDDE
jgi:hypothetical protein